MATALTSIQTTLPVLLDMLTQLTAISGAELLSVASGIIAVSAALAAFGAGSAVSGIGSAIGEFFGGDPIEKFQRLAALANPLNIVATAIKTISESISGLNSALSSIDIGKLEDLQSALETPMTAKISAIGDKIGDKISGLFGGGEIKGKSSAAEFSAMMPPTNTPVQQGATAQQSIAQQTTQMTAQTTAPAQTTPAVNVTTGGGGVDLKGVQQALLAVANRPIVVQIGDMELKTLNKRMRGMNNNV
jgi:hypothetical protein